MTIKLDKNTIEHFKSKKSKNILLYFYDAWCSWTKINISDDFEINDELTCLNCHPEIDSGSLKRKNTINDSLSSPEWQELEINIYVKKIEKELFNNCSITRTVKKDHTWKEKIRYIFTSNKVKDRCGCWSSFSFREKKKPKIDLEKLKSFKNKFN